MSSTLSAAMERQSSFLDASFSYLRTAGNSTKNQTEPVQFPSAAAIPSSHKCTVPFPSNAVLEKSKPREAEISVFGAEKYFNMKLEVDCDDNDGNSRMLTETNAAKYVCERENLADLHRMRPRSRIGTPSVTSEVSSNRRVALLPNSLRNPSRKYNKKVNNNRWFLACNGTCTEKGSVYIDKNPENRGVPARKIRNNAIKAARNPILMEGKKQSQQLSRFHDSSFEKTSVGSKREEYYVLPTVNSGVQSLMNVNKEEQKEKIIEELPRMSIEVFGNHSMRREDIAKNLERKLSVLTWDAIPKGANNLAREDDLICVDIASDASSDLFEIESAQQMYTKQTSDGMSRCMTPSRYAPSEASIEWSVATASAADVSSATNRPAKIKLAQGSLSASTPRRSRHRILLGCRSQKAVDVGETTYNRPDHRGKLQHARLDGSMAVRKLQVDSKVKDFDFLSRDVVLNDKNSQLS